MTPTQRSLLVVVHPGSACGSAEFNLGRYEARAARECLARDIAEWDGPIVVLDGALSDELKEHRHLNDAIEAALKRAGTMGCRIWACDEEGLTSEAAGLAVKRMKLKAGEWNIQVTGCWYHADDDAGCVNAVYDSFETLGFKVDVRDSAVTMPGDEDNEVEEPVEEATDGFSPW